MRNRISRDYRGIGRIRIYRSSIRNPVSPIVSTISSISAISIVSAGISVLSGIYRLILLLQTSKEGSPVFTGLPSKYGLKLSPFNAFLQA
ncbi:hypothetical protein [Oribacterium parvum]|uniref:hypothetical protein n=1 Tax=Oribacterium parvum TaxID=1501329 RepID=UPI0028EEC622|nr:hypothetical protein [Oribacterium parvum]